jgi:hypothetical protein
MLIFSKKKLIGQLAYELIEITGRFDLHLCSQFIALYQVRNLFKQASVFFRLMVYILTIRFRSLKSQQMTLLHYYAHAHFLTCH